MKRTILILTIGLALIGTNIYAAGDLIVNGKLGVGVAIPNAKIDAISTDQTGLYVSATKSANTTYFLGSVITADGNSSSNAAVLGLSLSASSSTIGATTGAVVGVTGVTEFFGSGNITSYTGFVNNVSFNTTSGNYTIGTGRGQDINLITANAATGNHTITSYYGLHSRGSDNSPAATIGGTNWRHAYFENFPDYSGTITNVTGLWIDKQTRGTNNYGIVLNGDGTGSDIVFGTSNNVKLYASGGDLYVKDAANNVTMLGPHDAETGEWIFYSKNVKTGRVVRVEMEKLVKAVEKLTGEKFMVESVREEK